ncbi:conserved hypothetical protein [Clostridium perfringens D str. JGS1721]|uniref:Uncharacterized protein n=1 Tax=Clostridium perfringens D str. JGS1721 TaxID=488537 RepID=B1V2M8_CLOPF|nr:hypothetical protein [Clostridium perfringens]EDT71942.1 conserved hypothetical protein [Clostridium perfringens D str. JGS1721]
MKEEVMDKAIKKALKEFKEEEREEKKKKVLHNTKLLLRNFNNLKTHSDKAKYDISEIDIEAENGDDRAYILSIRRSKLRTLIMVSHIEMAMSELKENKIRSGSLEQYRALEMFYIEKKSYGEIRDKLNCGQNTRECKIVCVNY